MLKQLKIADMKKKNESKYISLIVAVISILIFVALSYYVLFHGFIHDWVVELVEIVKYLSHTIL